MFFFKFRVARTRLSRNCGRACDRAALVALGKRVVLCLGVVHEHAAHKLRGAAEVWRRRRDWRWRLTTIARICGSRCRWQLREPLDLSVSAEALLYVSYGAAPFFQRPGSRRSPRTDAEAASADGEGLQAWLAGWSEW